MRIVTALLIIASLILTPFATIPVQAANDTSNQFQQIDPLTPDSPNSRGSLADAQVEQLSATPIQTKVNAATTTGSAEIVSASSVQVDTYIVVLEGDPLATYRGTIAGLAATSPKATGATKLSARTAESRAYLTYVEAQQASFIATATRELGHPLEITYRYQATLNGFAARMTGAEAARIAKLAGVRFVEKERLYELHTDAGPNWIGAPEIWGGELTALPFSATLSGANEVPANASAASGTATFRYNIKTKALHYDIAIAEIDNVVAAHIHRAPAGSNGGVAHGLFAAANGGTFDPDHPISGTVTLSDEDQALLMSAGLYVNVHSTDFPDGEIRGQILSQGTLGEGVVVGVIDTGVDPWNPSFAATGDDGYTHQNPLGEGTYLGVCDPANTAPAAGVVAYDPTFPCNEKLIGVWGFSASDPSPRDTDGHGSHTASTAAGNVVKDPVVQTPTGSFTVDLISGVAPHANVIVYDGCIDGGGCPGASLQAARDQALLDGVDVINYSIGATTPTADPYNDAEAISWLALREAGVFVATSAGNSGPGDATVGSPADLPWVTSVGANSHNRAFISTVTLNGSGTPLTLSGMALSTGYGPAPILFAADFVIAPTSADDARFCAPDAFPPGTFNGEIVVCERGVYGRVAKGQSVADGGAGGFILAQPNETGGGPGSLVADTHVLPASHIDYYAYQELLAYVDAAPGAVTAELSGGILNVADSNADIMADFSSRGPNRGVFNELIVPSITAPGRSIWAAYHQGEGGDGDFTYNVIAGTSMASPHLAGAGALMVALHPEWSPAEIQSALMSTARTPITNDDGSTPATPFAEGSGEVDLRQAAHAGLVLDVTTQEYLAANPAEGGDVKTLNLASMADAQCLLNCSWTRTVKSTLAVAAQWSAASTSVDGLVITVEPAQFTLEPGATQELVITVDAGSAPQGEWLFGQVTLIPSGDTPAAHFPVAIISASSIVPASVTIESRRDAGSQLVEGLKAVAIRDLTIETAGLTSGEVMTFSLSTDPTNDDPYDNLNDGTVTYYNVTVPEGALRLSAQILDAEAPDLDLYVGQGSTPSAASEVCVSASGTSLETCLVDYPDGGEWWVLVQNWEASADAPDGGSIALVVVAEDAGNLWVEGPSTVGSGEEFDLRVYWDEAELDAGETWYGAFTLGTDAQNPGNLGTIFVVLNRHEDDVTKSVSPAEAEAGSTVTYEIVVNTNVTPVDLAYTLTDIIPAGLTYVEGSATASNGTVSVTGNTLQWSGVMTAETNFVGGYLINTNQQDEMCVPPIGDGGYVDAASSYGFNTDPGISGDTTTWAYNSFAGTDFYGTERAAPPRFTDDGIVVFGEYSGQPWINQALPNAAAPNGLYAPYWRDMEVVYDEAANRGVTAITFGGGVFWLMELDGIQAYDDPSTILDMEVMAWNDIDPSAGSYDVYYAYDNVSVADSLGTIGVENDAGDAATQFAYNNFTPTDGLVICLDYVGLTPTVITFDAVVDSDVTSGTLTNVVTHNTDNPGSKEASASADLLVTGGSAESNILFLSSSSSGKIGELNFRDEDILAYDAASQQWSMLFDGSDVGVGGNDVDALQVMADGSILVSFTSNKKMADRPGYHGPDRLYDTNIYRFVPYLLGWDTIGVFELYFEGVDVGLDRSSEDIDALYVAANGDLLISTNGSYAVPAGDGTTISGRDEDLLRFRPTSLGETTAGSWTLFLDGSEEGLSKSNEDIWGVWASGESEIFLTTSGNFEVPGLSGDGADIFICSGPPCTYSAAVDGSAIGLDGEKVDGFSFGTLPAFVSAATAQSIAEDTEAEAYDELDDDLLDDDDESLNIHLYVPFIAK